MNSSKFDPARETPIGRVCCGGSQCWDKSKCKDACQAACVARTSDGRYIGRYINRHYNLNTSWDAPFMTVSSVRSPCDAAAFVSNMGDSKRYDFIQDKGMDAADV
ncbi:hypothetical protein [Paraburkholderia sp. SIMBA_030]|uniref:hypothetical protein n=1 Tax=Paraburkholderia sp. SIMBA_030 TaxID=3085773 RepID=UPI003979869D